MSNSLSRSTLFCCRPSGHAFERMTRTCWTRPARFRLSPSDLTGTLGTTDTVGTCPCLSHIIGPDFVCRLWVLTSNYSIALTSICFVLPESFLLECYGIVGLLTIPTKTYTLLLHLALTPGFFCIGAWRRQLTSDSAFKLKCIVTEAYLGRYAK